MHSASSGQVLNRVLKSFQTGPWKKHPLTGRLYRSQSPATSVSEFLESIRGSVTPEMEGENSNNDRPDYNALYQERLELQERLKDMQNAVNQLMFEKEIEAEKLKKSEEANREGPKTEVEQQMIVLMDKMRKLEAEHKPDLMKMSLYPGVSLPLNFTCPTFDDKFKGTGDPRIHVAMYVRMLTPLGATGENLAQLFQNSLADPAKRWFLKQTHLVTWEQIVEAFIEEYKWSTEVETTRRELGTLQQKKGESVNDYVHRFQAKVSEMTQDRPSQTEVMDMICMSMRPAWKKKMTFVSFSSLNELVVMGQKIEIAIKEGMLTDDDEGSTSRKRKAGDDEEVCGVAYQRGYVPRNQGGLQKGQPIRRSPLRHFSVYTVSLSKIFTKLRDEGKLSPRKPNLNYKVKGSLSEYCAFHQNPGHDTDDCPALRHEIQNLIERGEMEIPKEEEYVNF